MMIEKLMISFYNTFMKLQTILNHILHADQDFNLIKDHDVICVGVSGGKDSMVLLAALYAYSRYSKHPFSIKAIHLKLGFSEVDMSPVENWCKKSGIEYHCESTRVAEALAFYEQSEGKRSCSRCSKYKKACISEAARKYNCNKIAFAHHGDDAVETLFLNMIHGGRLATFQPKMVLERNQLTFIRPLIYCSEDEIRKVAISEHLPIVKSGCPNDGITQRTEMKNMLENLYRNYPQAKNNFYRMLWDEEHINLWHKIKNKEPE